MSKCFMCGASIAKGILCEKCDKPRKKGQEADPVTAKPTGPPVSASPPQAPPPAKQQPAPPRAAPAKTPAAPSASQVQQNSRPAAPPRVTKPAAPPPPSTAPKDVPQVSREAVAPQFAAEPFPKAPVVPFPVEAASPALTSVASILVAAGVPAILVAPDRSVKFVSDEAKHLFEVPSTQPLTLKDVEAKTGLRIGELSVPVSSGMLIRNTSVLYSLVPLSGGAGGAVLIFRYAETDAARAPFVTYVRETILGPLRSLRDSLLAASKIRAAGDPLLKDSAGTIDQILSSLEMAPEVGDPAPSANAIPTVTDVIHRVAERFRPFADLKGIRLQVDVQELEERFHDSDQLAESLAILMDNALHYVPGGGQVVIGCRWMEHKSKPLLLFFVMDNGPLVPESMRQAIFEPAFVWNPQSPERTGRSLFRAREFAVAHSGSVWVESKTGKVCTFFLRVRPDGV